MFMIGVALLALTIVPVYIISIVFFNANTIWGTIKRLFFTILTSAIIILIIASVFLSSVFKTLMNYVEKNEDDLPAIEQVEPRKTNVVQDKYCVVDKMGIKRCPDGHYEY